MDDKVYATNVNEFPRGVSTYSNPELDATEIGYVLEGKRIQAVKRYRDRNGTGLHEAKNAVDDFMRRHEMVVVRPCAYCNGKGIVESFTEWLGDRSEAEAADEMRATEEAKKYWDNYEKWYRENPA